MTHQLDANPGTRSKGAFLSGVFLIAFSVLVFQITQTRILSVMAWYYLAFFAISVSMLGMTVGAVWVYLRGSRFRPGCLGSTLSDYSLACAVGMPASLLVQFSLVTTLTLTLSTVMSWSLLLFAMAVPYVFAGVVLSLALTRSPFPVHQVYGADLVGAALGCLAVVLVLDVLDAPSTILLAGVSAGIAAHLFASGADERDRHGLNSRKWWLRPAPVVMGLALFTSINALTPFGIRPLLVKDHVERPRAARFEKWNSYSRVTASMPRETVPHLWAPSPKLPADATTRESFLSIDGAAGTVMYPYDGTRESIDFLRYDMVNLAYSLPGMRKAAVIGVGGGRDVLSAHLYGVSDITGVEINPIFIALHTEHPFFSAFSNLASVPGVRFVVDDARSWFASTEERFDLIQMSMIDTWAATGAGALTLSENGLYTLEGWRTFLEALTEDGVFTVSRWHHPGDVNEAGRMISLATAALLDSGVSDARAHIFVASSGSVATLVLARRPFPAGWLRGLHEEVDRLGFDVLLAPGESSRSDLLAAIVASRDIETIDRVSEGAFLDLSVPTDERPFFFNQLRFRRIPELARRILKGEAWGGGVIQGNLLATAALLMILSISLVALVGTILLPLRRAAKDTSTALVAFGSCYFWLIGTGFMLAEIGLLQFFSIYLGHPIHSLAVCLFSLILATGAGSLASGRVALVTRRRFAVWGSLVGAYLLALQYWLTDVFRLTAGAGLPVRIGVSIVVVMSLGFLLGFAFPTGMRLVEVLDRKPTPWFWGINGATGVMASVLAVVLSMAFGIRVTLVVSSLCYFCLILAAMGLMRLGREKVAAEAVARAEWRADTLGYRNSELV